MRITSKLATIALTSGLVVAGFAGSASAASTDPSPTTAHVSVSSGITLIMNTPSFTLTGAPGATITGLGAVAYNVETNNVAGYSVTVAATGSAMLGTGVLVGGVPNADTIPITDLTARDSGTTNTFAPLSTGTTEVHTQGGRSVTGGDNLHTDYQIRIPVVNADTYTATLNYVASTL